MSDQEKMGMLRNPLRVLRLQGLLKQSAAQFLGSRIKSQKLLNFYDKLCASYAYVNMKETPAIMALTMFTDNHVGGTHYVATSAQTYSNTLERAIERNGGTVLYKRKVKQILFEEDRASGVILADDTKIHAERVVSDTTVWNLYNNLIPPDRVTQKQSRWVNSLIPTYPAMVLYAAVSKSAFPPDINPVEYYIRDPERIDMNDITLYIPSVDDGSLGPSDEHIITIFSPSPNSTWPHPWDPEYRSPSYLKQKDEQAKLIIGEIERRIPGFTHGIKRLYVATPSTIERYTLKNSGCVGGPKQMIGQEISKRLHGVTEWPGLYACGDSTTMGMGMPAVTASGFGAANAILREMKKKEYRVEDAKRNYVNYVSSQPPLNIPDEIDGDPKNASLLARECQHCEDQPCRVACPANVDIAGTIRRIEAKNYAGAARLIRETNPLPETCGYLCKNKELCEKHCVRTEFASKAVRIRDLHRWVVEYVGEEGWVKPVSAPNGKSVCVIGAGPSGLTCAHYLARLGYSVELLDRRGKLGGELRDLVEKGILAEGALDRDLSGLMLPSISFRGDTSVADLDLMELSRKHAAVYVSIEAGSGKALEESHGNLPNVIQADKVYNPSESEYGISQAVADGRKSAEAIHKIAKR